MWERAKAFVDEVLPRMDGLWDRGEYDLDLARRMGELDLFTDGLVHDRARATRRRWPRAW